MARVTREVVPGCEWALRGEGHPTRKWDGTNIRVTVREGVIVGVEKRRNPSRAQKAQGVEPGYVLASADDPADIHIFAACGITIVATWPDGAWSCEALGPKIQGGVENVHGIIPFSMPRWAENHTIPTHLLVARAERGAVMFDYNSISAYLQSVAIEGIVFHHPDGRMAKIKRRDFGHSWPVPSVVAEAAPEGT